MFSNYHSWGQGRGNKTLAQLDQRKASVSNLVPEMMKSFWQVLAPTDFPRKPGWITDPSFSFYDDRQQGLHYLMRNTRGTKYIWTVQDWRNVCVHGILQQKEPLIPLLQFSLVSCPCGPDSTAVYFLILQAWVRDTTLAHREGEWISSINGFTPKEHDGEPLWSQTGPPPRQQQQQPTSLSTAYW